MDYPGSGLTWSVKGHGTLCTAIGTIDTLCFIPYPNVTLCLAYLPGTQSSHIAVFAPGSRRGRSSTPRSAAACRDKAVYLTALLLRTLICSP